MKKGILALFLLETGLVAVVPLAKVSFDKGRVFLFAVVAPSFLARETLGALQG
nr:sodium-dependent bicarbonate transport family permease [Methylophaga thiooxydans]